MRRLLLFSPFVIRNRKMKSYPIVFFLLVVPAIQCQPGKTAPTPGGGWNAGSPVDPNALYQELSADLTGPNGILKGLGLDDMANSLLTGLIGPNGKLTSLLGGKFGNIIAVVLREFLSPNGVLSVLVGPNGSLAGQSKLIGEVLNDIIGPDGMLASLFGPGGILGDHLEERVLVGGLLKGVLGGLLNTVIKLVLKLLSPIIGPKLYLGRSIEERGVLSGVLGSGGLVPGILHAIFGKEGLLEKIFSGVFGSHGILSGVFGGGSHAGNQTTGSILGKGGLVPGIMDAIFGKGGLLEKISSGVFGSHGILAGVFGGDKGANIMDALHGGNSTGGVKTREESQDNARLHGPIQSNM